MNVPRPRLPTVSLPRPRLPTVNPSRSRSSTVNPSRSRLATRSRAAVTLLLVGVLLLAAGTYALTTALGSSHSGSAAATGPAPWIGVQMESLPVGGAVIVTVAPGSPAEAAGLEPGDVITTIDNRPVSGAADVTSALAGLHAGEVVQIGVSRGSTLFTTPLTLGSRPPGSP